MRYTYFVDFDSFHETCFADIIQNVCHGIALLISTTGTWSCTLTKPWPSVCLDIIISKAKICHLLLFSLLGKKPVTLVCV